MACEDGVVRGRSLYTMVHIRGFILELPIEASAVELRAIMTTFNTETERDAREEATVVLISPCETPC